MEKVGEASAEKGAKSGEAGRQAQGAGKDHEKDNEGATVTAEGFPLRQPGLSTDKRMDKS